MTTKFELIRAFDPERAAVINTYTEQIEKFFEGDDRVKNAAIYRDQLNAIQSEIGSLSNVKNVKIDQGAVWVQSNDPSAEWKLRETVDEAIAALSAYAVGKIAADNSLA